MVKYYFARRICHIENPLKTELLMPRPYVSEAGLELWSAASGVTVVHIEDVLYSNPIMKWWFPV